MADIFYVESGYAEFDGYAVKTADASIVQTRTAKTVTVTGNAALSSSVYKFPRGSIAFDGTGDYLTVTPESSFRTGTNSFTIEAWFYPTAGAKTHRIFFKGTTTTNSIRLSGNSSNQFSCIIGDLTISGGTLTLNTWHHIAAVRSGNTVYLFVNGTQVATGSTTVNINNTDPMIIGGSHLTASESAQGYIDEVRFTNSALYTGATYTVPTAPFFNNGQTELLLHGTGATIADDAGVTGVNAYALVSSTITKIKRGTSTLNAIAAVTNTTKRTRNITKTISAVATLASTPTRAKKGVATLNAVSSLTKTIKRIRPGTASMATQATVSSNAFQITPASATLSTQASVSTTYKRTRNVSKSLSAIASFSSIGARTRVVSKTLNSTATLSSTPTRRRVDSATLNATTAVQIDIDITRAAASLLASSGSITIHPSVIKRVGLSAGLPGQKGTYLDTGFRTSSTQYLSLTDSDLPNHRIVDNTTIAFWFKADDANATNTFVDWSWNGDIQTKFRIRKVGSTLELYAYNNLGINSSWLTTWNLSTNDTNWHQYTIHCEKWDQNFVANGLQVRAFQDGVDLGLNTTFGSTTSWYNTQYLASTIAFGNSSSGNWAELWIGLDNSFAISNYYRNGWVDIAATGWVDIPGNFDYGNKVSLIRNGTVQGKDYLLLPNVGQLLSYPTVATLTVDPSFVYRRHATLSTTASLSCDADKYNVSPATLNATSSLTVNADVQAGGAAPMIATASMSSKGNATFSHHASLSATASVTKANSTYAIFGVGTLRSTASMKVKTSSEATLSTNASITVNADFITQGHATVNSSVEITAHAFSGRIGTATINAEATLFGKLTVVPVPDDLQTIFVPADTRGLRILPETRFATVEMESNLNRILAETRDIIVDIESRELREAVDPALEVTTARIRRIPA